MIRRFRTGQGPFFLQQEKRMTITERNISMDIEALIPHRDQMKLIDFILEINDEGATTTAKVSDRWPLYKADSVDPIVMIELVAQTAAVYISGRKQGRHIVADKRGWMVGIKKADFFCDRIPLDTVLKTDVKSLQEIDQYSVLVGEVYAGVDLLCRLQIQVLRESDIEFIEK
jgi:predicted hotdog family 3-hydroxylacyl-ACP dehydratase